MILHRQGLKEPVHEMSRCQETSGLTNLTVDPIRRGQIATQGERVENHEPVCRGFVGIEQGWVKSLCPVHVDQRQHRWNSGNNGDKFASTAKQCEK